MRENNLRYFPIRRGLTLLEMLIALVCLVIIMIVAYGSMYDSSLSSANLSAWNDLIVWTQTSIDKINLELTQARLIYQNDAFGNAYISNLELDSRYPVLVNSKLPLIDVTGQISVDTTANRTGNALFFIQELPHFLDDTQSTIRRVDTYSFAFYYLSKINRPISTRDNSLRLIKWTSVPFASYNQVMAIPQTDRTAFAVNLYNSGIEYLCVPRNMPDNAFYIISPEGSISALNNYTVQKRESLSVVDALGAGFASVAWNSAKDFQIPNIVPKFAIGHAFADGFPHGFEIQVVGLPAARKVLVRLVLAYYVNLNKSLYSHESITITTFHEF